MIVAPGHIFMSTTWGRPQFAETLQPPCRHNSTMASVRDLAASAFMVTTAPVAVYHSVQAARKSNVSSASDPHVQSAYWYLAGGWFGEPKISADRLI